MDARSCPDCGATIPADAPGGQCPACLQLRALDDTGSERANSDGTTEATTDAVHTMPTFGPYRTVRLLGTGGMGLVYLAEQITPVRRMVALKVIKPGSDSKQVAARFDAERQALALLQHPAIAAIYDGGTTPDGHPFFAMEYVPGSPITQYCDDHRLSVGGRLELFLQVCAAIQHAHQKGIIHRDLKPSNLLVMRQDDRPLVKVIDFGVAKAVAQRLTERTLFTQYGAVIGTPAYMSPEQAGATQFDVDTRTDVYSLGVVLYELLTGLRPFEAQELHKAALVEMLRVIREVQPPRLTVRISSADDVTAAEIARHRQADVRSLARQLRGDLEWITLRALEKEPARRYGSASDLGSDLRRHLLHEPVSAGPPRLSYRVGKFVRKHRAAVGAMLAILIALTMGLVSSLALYVRADAAASLARRQGYIATIAAADLGLQAHSAGEAHRRLLQTDPSLRGWEWRHLWLASDTSLAKFEGDGAIEVRSVNFDASDRRIVWDTGGRLHSVEPASSGRVLSRMTTGLLLSRTPDGGRGVVVPNWPTGDLIGTTHFTPGDPEVRDLRSGVAIAKTGFRGPFPFPVILSPDGARIVMGEPDLSSPAGDVPGRPGARISLLDANSGREIARLRLPEPLDGPMSRWNPTFAGIAFSPDGRQLAACQNLTLRQWNAATGNELMTSRGDSGPVTAVRSGSRGIERAGLPVGESPQGPAGPIAERRGAPASGGGRRPQQQAPGGGLVDAVGDGAEGLVTLSYTNDGTKLLCLNATDTLVQWEAVTGRVIATWQRPRLGRPLAFSPDGSQIAWGVGPRILIADAATNDVRAELRGHTGDVTTAEFSHDGRLIVSGAHDRSVRLWNTEGDRAVTRLRTDGRMVTGIAFHANDRQIVAGNVLNTIEIWDLESARRVDTLEGHRSPVLSVVMSPDGKTLISGGQDGTIYRWNLAEGRPAQTLGDVHGRAVQALALDPRRLLVVSASLDKIVRVWDGVSGRLLARLSDTGGQVGSLAMSFDGSRAAGGEESGALILWDTATWRPLHHIHAHTGRIGAVGFSPDAMRVASGGDDSVIRLWDAPSGRAQGTLAGHEGPVTALAFSPDGGRLVSGGADGTVRVWDALHLDLLLTLRHDAPVSSVAVNRTGSRIAASSINGTILIWNTPED